MFADRVMRGEEGSEFQTRHGFLSRFIVLVALSLLAQGKLRGGEDHGNRRKGHAAHPA
jgi:hypothetical protein